MIITNNGRVFMTEEEAREYDRGRDDWPTYRPRQNVIEGLAKTPYALGYWDEDRRQEERQRDRVEPD